MTPFTAVVTTGIYCRAGCPATPLRRNTRAYRYAAAAEAAGFRACLRCRPDREPDPGWVDAPELVCRALRLVAAGALDGANEDDLARRVGVSARHLRRLFDAHVGATPDQVARSRRAHFARRLLDDTDLSIAAVSRAAGFASVRHMNRTMQTVFRAPPTALRARRQAAGRSSVDGGLDLRLPYRPPLAWDEMLAFLAARAIPGVEAVDLDARAYRRTVSLDGHPGVVEVHPPADDAPYLVLRAHLPAFDGLVHLVARVRRMFDLDADPEAIDRHLARDPELAPLVHARPGLRVPGALDPLELGVRAVLGQQVRVAHATRLAARLVARHGTPVAGAGSLGLSHVFPDAATLAAAPLDGVGLTAARADAVRALAAAAEHAELPADGTADLEAGVRTLRGIRGVGAWTAHYVAMRAFGERDAFPAGDRGLRAALGAPHARAAASRAEPWRPWRAYAAVHLWTELAAASRPPRLGPEGNAFPQVGGVFRLENRARFR